MQAVQIPNRKFEQVGMDITGPLPRTRTGNRFVLVVVDYLSRWPELIAMPDQEATTIVKAFVNKVVARWGVPKKVVTDQGSNFGSAVVRLVYQQLGIARSSTTPYHPQSNGLVERYNRTLKDTVVKLAADYEAEWDQHLDWAAGNYRFALNDGLGDSPFFVVTGQDPRLPVTAVADDAEVEAMEGTVAEWKRQFFARMTEVSRIAELA
jgi:hypothetical protein